MFIFSSHLIKKKSKIATQEEKLRTFWRAVFFWGFCFPQHEWHVVLQLLPRPTQEKNLQSESTCDGTRTWNHAFGSITQNRDGTKMATRWIRAVALCFGTGGQHKLAFQLAVKSYRAILPRTGQVTNTYTSMAGFFSGFYLFIFFIGNWKEWIIIALLCLFTSFTVYLRVTPGVNWKAPSRGDLPHDTCVRIAHSTRRPRHAVMSETHTHIRTHTYAQPNASFMITASWLTLFYSYF